MTGLWHRVNPTLYQKEKSEVETHYPDLHFVRVGDSVRLCGTFAVTYEGRVLDRYSVELQLARDHPKSLPLVREVGGRIPQHEHRHINPRDGMACVLLPDERWRVWPPGSSLLSFLTGPVHSFFLAQSLVDLGHPCPFGQWEHGAKGIFQYYSELLKTSDVRVICNFLECLAAKKVKGHWRCPCRNGRLLRHCHSNVITDLKEKICRRDATKSLEMLRAAGPLSLDKVPTADSVISISASELQRHTSAERSYLTCQEEPPTIQGLVSPPQSDQKSQL